MTEIAIIGGGLMGHGIALVMALGGHSVRITDTNPRTLAAVPGLVASALDTLREAGAVDRSWTAERATGAIRLCGDLTEAVAGAALAIEAITEQPDAKRALFADVDRLCGPETILASNTSYLDVFPLIPKARQARAIVAHWYTPPYIVDLVDVVPGPETDAAVVTFVRDLVLGLGQVPIVLKRFIPGYVANRIQSAIYAEVYHLLDQGIASPREIDDAMVHGLALRIPILALLAKADFTGLELFAARPRQCQLPAARAPDELLRSGRPLRGRPVGIMAGRGFFDWGGKPPEELFRERDRKLLALKAAFRSVGRMEGS